MCSTQRARAQRKILKLITFLLLTLPVTHSVEWKNLRQFLCESFFAFMKVRLLINLHSHTDFPDRIHQGLEMTNPSSPNESLELEWTPLNPKETFLNLNELKWTFLNPPELKGKFLNPPEQFWTTLNSNELSEPNEFEWTSWTRMNPVEPEWTPLNPLETFWTLMNLLNPNEPLRTLLKPFELKWILLIHPDSSEPCWTLWTQMNLFNPPETFWTLMNLLEPS